MNPHPSEYSPTSRRDYLYALVALLSLGLLHVYLTWGYGGVFWGDHGRWLQEIDRFARGGTLYEDFYWPFPPLALWLVGGLARFFGSGVVAVSTLTALLFLVLLALYARYLTILLDPPLAVMTGLAAVLLAISYIQLQGPPLPLGAYTPAASLGVLLLFACTIGGLRLLEKPSMPTALMVGALAASMILTKQDFWIPAAFVLLASAWHLHSRRTYRTAAVLVLGFGLVLAIGLTLIGMTAGFELIPGAATGFGEANRVGIARAVPSLERLVVNGITLGLAIAALFMVLAFAGYRPRRFRLLAFAALLIAIAGSWLHLEVTQRIAVAVRTGVYAGPPTATVEYIEGLPEVGLLRVALSWLKRRLEAHALSIFLPVLATGAVLYFRSALSSAARKRLLFLLLLALAGRARRLFEFVEWWHILFELPVYILLIQELFKARSRRIRTAILAGLTLLIPIAVYAYREFSRGPLTERGRYEEVRTVRGTMHWPSNEAADYRRLRVILDSIDAGGERPLFAFGINGGFNYFYDRRNPSVLTQGFRFAPVDPPDVVEEIMSATPPPILIDMPIFDYFTFPSGDWSPLQWEVPHELSGFARRDRPIFDRMLERCGDPSPVEFGIFLVYDCAAPAAHPSNGERRATLPR